MNSFPQKKKTIHQMLPAISIVRRVSLCNQEQFPYSSIQMHVEYETVHLCNGDDFLPPGGRHQICHHFPSSAQIFPVRAGEGSTNCEIRMQIYLRKLCFSLASSCFCCSIIIIAGITAAEPKVDKVHLTIDISSFLALEKNFLPSGKTSFDCANTLA